MGKTRLSKKLCGKMDLQQYEQEFHMPVPLDTSNSSSSSDYDMDECGERLITPRAKKKSKTHRERMNIQGRATCMGTLCKSRMQDILEAISPSVDTVNTAGFGQDELAVLFSLLAVVKPNMHIVHRRCKSFKQMRKYRKAVAKSQGKERLCVARHYP